MARAQSVKRAVEYSVHPSVAMVQKTIAQLKEKTGRSLDEWMAVIREGGPADAARRPGWLKKQHKLGTNYAAWLSDLAEGRGWEDGDPRKYLRAAGQYVEDLYAGGKQGLRPVHDALLQMARRVAKDIRVCPCQTMVPLFRKHVIAQIKPATRTRIDFGLCLRGHPGLGRLPRRLKDTGGLARKDRITHAIALGAVVDVDEEVEKWLRVAYELDE